MSKHPVQAPTCSSPTSIECCRIRRCLVLGRLPGSWVAPCLSCALCGASGSAAVWVTQCSGEWQGMDRDVTPSLWPTEPAACEISFWPVEVMLKLQIGCQTGSVWLWEGMGPLRGAPGPVGSAAEGPWRGLWNSAPGWVGESLARERRRPALPGWESGPWVGGWVSSPHRERALSPWR